MRNSIPAAFLLPLALPFAIPISLGTIIEVPGDHAVLQDGIAAATAGDTVLVHPGVYLGAITIGKDITVTSIDPGDRDVVASTIIDAQGDDSAVKLYRDEPGPAILSGFTVRGGTGSGQRSTAGGGIHVSRSGSTIIRDCIVKDNYAEWWGGGIYLSKGSTVIARCTIQNNFTYRSSGGGIYVDESSVDAQLRDCTIRENRAYAGGAISAHAALTIYGCEIHDNHAGNVGAAIYMDSGASVQIRNSDINGNHATNDAAILFGLDAVVSIFSTTVAENWVTNPPGCAFYLEDSFLWADNSIFWDAVQNQFSTVDTPVDLTYSDVLGGWPGEGNISADPLFCLPQCTKMNLMLAEDSPCVGAGREGQNIGNHGVGCELPLELRPVTRRVPEDYSRIEWALDAACSGDTILVAPGTHAARVLRIDIDALTITGVDPSDPTIVAATVLQGDDDATAVQIFADSIGFRGMTVRGAETGIYASGGVTIADCIVSLNGFGIVLPYWSPTWSLIERCTIRENRDGGGVNGARTIRDCLISDNRGYYGGGLSARSDASIESCTIVNNEATEGAGIYFNGGGSALNTIVWNEAGNEIYSEGGEELQYCDVQGGWPGEGNFDADPRFCNISCPPFRLHTRGRLSVPGRRQGRRRRGGTGRGLPGAFRTRARRAAGAHRLSLAGRRVGGRVHWRHHSYRPRHLPGVRPGQRGKRSALARLGPGEPRCGGGDGDRRWRRWGSGGVLEAVS